MKLRDFLIGVAAGLTAAVIIKEASEKISPYTSADKVLENIKAQFKALSAIDGSWILMQPENYTDGIISTEVYRGGISRTVNDTNEYFEFAADARTGVVVHLQRM